MAHDQDRNYGRLFVDPLSRVSVRHVNLGCEAVSKAAQHDSSSKEKHTHLPRIWPMTATQSKAKRAQLEPNDGEDPHGAKAAAESTVVDVQGHGAMGKFGVAAVRACAGSADADRPEINEQEPESHRPWIIRGPLQDPFGSPRQGTPRSNCIEIF